MITKTQAQYIVKQLNGEISSLTPSSIIHLFEIDITDILTAKEIAVDQNIVKIFRFHNNIPQIGTSIYFDSNRDGVLEEFIAAPIIADGFEINNRGTLPTPRLAITSSEEGIPQLSIFKKQIALVEDIAGAKVTRIKTFAKCLDPRNFVGNSNPEYDAALVNSELQRDIFYIDRKSNENKSSLEYELSSIFDLDGLYLPNRVVVANHCIWSYRGEGCLYEFATRRYTPIHGEKNESGMPINAPPVANENDELISDLIPGWDSQGKDRGEYNSSISYNIGEWIYIMKDGIKYYFVAKQNGVNAKPPNPLYWIADKCSKTIKGCKLRYGPEGDGVMGQDLYSVPNPTFGNALPFGGFPATSKIR